MKRFTLSFAFPVLVVVLLIAFNLRGENEPNKKVSPSNETIINLKEWGVINDG
ncbi:hypothetical protein MNBD_PLANCTO02-196, partial [hydrothermal vent metagenome]